jgi:hypothetical protein
MFLTSPDLRAASARSDARYPPKREREYIVDNLLVHIHYIIVMIR